MMKKPNLKNQLARALADYDNLGKRIEREKRDFEKKACFRLVFRLLPVLDALRQAQLHLKDSGLAIIVGELENIFKDEGIEEIKVGAGDEFKSELCEAVEVVETGGENEDNKIIEVALPGWKFTDGPVIRHAKVKVERSKIPSEVEGLNKNK